MRYDFDYGSFYIASVAARDGHVYTAHIERHAYSGPARSLPWLGLQISGGSDGGAVTGAGPLLPIAASRAVLTVRDRHGALAETVGSPDGAWRLRVRRETGNVSVSPADGGVGNVWVGYLLQEGYEDSPFAAGGATSLTFADGLGLLDARPAAGAGADTGTTIGLPATLGAVPGRRLLSLVAPSLFDLGADAGMGVTTAVDWRPWTPGTVLPSSADPVRALLAREDAWLDEDGGTVSVLESVRAVAGRLSARLFQSGGRWHLVQRGAVARTGGVDLPRFAYPAGDTSAVARSLATVARDTRAILQSGPHDAPKRGLSLPVASVESRYDFTPELDEVVRNPSFEVAGATPSDAAGWVLENGAIRKPMSESPIPSLNPANLDAYYLRIGPKDTGAGNPGGTARQNEIVYLPDSTAWDLAVSWDQYVLDGGATTNFLPLNGAKCWVGGDTPANATWGLVRARVTCAADALPGEDNAVTVENVLEGEGEPGAPYVPAGATLRWMRQADDNRFKLVATMTVKETVRGGDTKVRGTLTLKGVDASDDRMFAQEGERLRAGDFAEIHVWERDAEPDLVGLHYGGWALDVVSGSGAGAILGRNGRPAMYATGVDLDGDLISGYVNVEFSNVANGFSAIVDDVEVDLQMAGATATTTSAVSALPAGEAGHVVSLGPFLLGDGPTADSESALFVEADAIRPTHQGSLTGWSEGSPGANSSGVGLDLLQSRDGLRQLAGPLERVRTAFLLRDGQALAPEHVPICWSATALVYAANVGATTVYTYAAPRVGRTLTIAGVDHLVTDVVRGAGLFAVTVAVGLGAAAEAGERVQYDFAAWWDSFVWTVEAGEVYVDGTALDLDERSYLEEITLGTQ